MIFPMKYILTIALVGVSWSPLFSEPYLQDIYKKLSNSWTFPGWHVVHAGQEIAVERHRPRPARSSGASRGVAQRGGDDRVAGAGQRAAETSGWDGWWVRQQHGLCHGRGESWDGGRWWKSMEKYGKVESDICFSLTPVSCFDKLDVLKGKTTTCAVMARWLKHWRMLWACWKNCGLDGSLWRCAPIGDSNFTGWDFTPSTDANPTESSLC